MMSQYGAYVLNAGQARLRARTSPRAREHARMRARTHIICSTYCFSTATVVSCQLSVIGPMSNLAVRCCFCAAKKNVVFSGLVIPCWITFGNICVCACVQTLNYTATEDCFILLYMNRTCSYLPLPSCHVDVLRKWRVVANVLNKQGVVLQLRV